jgi:hypothetical protein
MRKVSLFGILLLFILTIAFAGCGGGNVSSSSTATEFTVDANTMALWHFDEGNGTTTADAAGHYNLTFENGPGNYPTFVAGKNGFNTCLSFSGSNEWLQTSVSTKVPFSSTGLTVEFWINLATLPTGVNVYDILQTSDMNGLNIYLDKFGYIYCELYDYVSSSNNHVYGANSTNGIPTDSAWHYVACTWDGSTIYVYIDGVLAASQAGVFSPQTEPCGGWYVGGIAGSSCLKGELDEMRVLTIADSATNIANYYNQNKSLYRGK